MVREAELCRPAERRGAGRAPLQVLWPLVPVRPVTQPAQKFVASLTPPTQLHRPRPRSRVEPQLSPCRSPDRSPVKEDHQEEDRGADSKWQGVTHVSSTGQTHPVPWQRSPPSAAPQCLSRVVVHDLLHRLVDLPHARPQPLRLTLPRQLRAEHQQGRIVGLIRRDLAQQAGRLGLPWG
jgi:hypothetical protein